MRLWQQTKGDGRGVIGGPARHKKTHLAALPRSWVFPPNMPRVMCAPADLAVRGVLHSHPRLQARPLRSRPVGESDALHAVVVPVVRNPFRGFSPASCVPFARAWLVSGRQHSPSHGSRRRAPNDASGDACLRRKGLCRYRPPRASCARRTAARADDAAGSSCARSKGRRSA